MSHSSFILKNDILYNGIFYQILPKARKVLGSALVAQWIPKLKDTKHLGKVVIKVRLTKHNEIIYDYFLPK